MDRQDAKPRRPSLLAGEQTRPAAQPASARILADMEGRESGSQGAAGTTRKRWLPMALLLVAVVATGWWWQSQPANGAATDAAPRLTADAVATHVSDEMVTEQAAAIIEEAVPASMASTSGIVAGDGTGNTGLSDPAINPMVAMGQREIAPARAASSDGTSNPFIVAAAPSTAAMKPVASRAPARKPGRASNRDEPDLLAILMGNIKPGQPSDDSHGSGLDAFLQTMDADSPGVASAERNRNGRPQRTRSQQIQQNLRECPAANTAKGLKCRQDICAVYAGRDPACPANG
ncbi:hypothetical protein [Lysobacter sp. F6437]|uniref:hypothetical protein n=1 Tax=Lysobacter sp. F6437 TaxID=3459296 RepID=UPI00403E1366